MDITNARIHANMIRRRFEGHSELVRQIVAEMDDDHLVEEYRHFIDAERRNLYAKAQQKSQ